YELGILVLGALNRIGPRLKTASVESQTVEKNAHAPSVSTLILERTVDLPLSLVHRPQYVRLGCGRLGRRRTPGQHVVDAHSPARTNSQMARIDPVGSPTDNPPQVIEKQGLSRQCSSRGYEQISKVPMPLFQSFLK